MNRSVLVSVATALVASIVFVVSFASAQPASSAAPPASAPPAAPSAPPSAAPSAPPVAPPADAPEDPAKASARAEFDEGLALLKRRAFADALTRFERSRATFPTRSATENIAVCLRELGRPDEAYVVFQDVLTGFGDVPEDVRARVDKQLREIDDSTGMLVVESSGGAPVISVDGRVRTPDATGKIRVLAGKRTVAVSRDGFVPKQVVVDVAAKTAQSVRVDLAVLLEAGRIAVTTADGRPADVFLDGVPVGKTPWEAAAAPGDHVIRLDGEGDLGAEPRRTKVVTGQVTRETFTLVALTAALTIDVVPPDATVTVRDVVMGTGRFSGSLAAGPITVTVSKPGMTTRREEVVLVPGPNKLSIELEPEDTAPPASFALDFTLGAAISPGFGGAAGDCSACEAPAAFGVSIRGTFAYEFAFGLGIGASVGYTHLAHAIEDRRVGVDVVGGTTIDAVADDDQGYDAFVPQAVAYFSFLRGVFPITVRLGADFAFGGLSSDRTVAVPDDPNLVGRTILDENSSGLSAFVLTPGLRLALPLGDVVSIGVGCDVDLFFPLAQPDHDRRTFTLESRTGGNPSAASVGRESLAGSVIVAPTPLLYTRFAL